MPLKLQAIIFALGFTLSLALAQITLTGCHLHEGQEVCLLPGGVETTILSATPSNAPNTAPASTPAQATVAAQTTAITDCHKHGVTQYCVKGDGEEVQVLATETSNSPLPTAYNDCHAHDTEMFCVAPDGSEVEVLAIGVLNNDSDHTEEGNGDCHFHAGVEHCPGHSETHCERRDRDYNVKLRIGLLFVIFATSGIAVYAPIILKKLFKINESGTVLTVIKQFGTGVIIATALIHLLTHAELMFGNSCLGELQYEATATSIAMAGAFIAFLIDYIAHRLASWQRNKTASSNIVEETHQSEKSAPKNAASSEASTNAGIPTLSHHSPSLDYTHPNDAISVLVLEAGIIFHSLLIGITLVVAGDSVFITLFIVIIFHQMFEGLALGARIAGLSTLRKTKYILLPLAFALVTPIGMAIGIGVLQKFNGNDPKTIVALGTLDSLSAGILLWVGFVDMWARDWIFGDLKESGVLKTLAAGVSLVAGMLLMGVLGKWA